MGEASRSVDVAIIPDPRSAASPDDLQQQFDFAWSINRKLNETHEAITRLRQVCAEDNRSLKPAGNSATAKSV